MIWGQHKKTKVVRYSARDYKNVQDVLGPGESAAVVMFQSMRIHQKSFCMFPLKFAAALLNCSRKGTIKV